MILIRTARGKGAKGGAEILRNPSKSWFVPRYFALGCVGIESTRQRYCMVHGSASAVMHESIKDPEKKQEDVPLQPCMGSTYYYFQRHSSGTAEDCHGPHVFSNALLL